MSRLPVSLLAGLLMTAAFASRDLAETAPTDRATSTRPAMTPKVADAPAVGIETIVFLRHGEKAEGGLGQLSPQGFNRALALIDVLPAKYGKPNFLFAPNPGTTQMREGEGSYDYVRALATIEPVAIHFSMPVRTAFGFSQVDLLNAELTQPAYANEVIYVAWEHAAAEKAVVRLLKQFGDSAVVPHWSGGDYDSLYVIILTRTAGQPTKVEFVHDHEGLTRLAKTMPAAARTPEQ